MHKHRLLLGFALLLLFGSACARVSQQADTAGIQVTMTAIPYPPYIGDSRLVLQVTDKLGRPIDNAHLLIKGDMTHAGMVPLLAEVDGGDADGVYDVPFEWTMAGDWVVTVDTRLPDGTEVQNRFDMTVLFENEEICGDDEQ